MFYVTQAEGYVAGMAAKLFVIAGPVLVFGLIRRRGLRGSAGAVWGSGVSESCFSEAGRLAHLRITVKEWRKKKIVHFDEYGFPVHGSEHR